ncbi:MAG: hypothetical protein WC442_00850 [Candidatus Omnitrophota bacterium]
MHKIRLLIAFLLIFVLPKTLPAQDGQDLPKLVMFHSPSCHRCIELKQNLMPEIESEFKGLVVFEYRDTSDIENYKMLLGLLQKYGKGVPFEVPIFYFNNKFLLAGEGVGTSLRNFIHNGLSKTGQAGTRGSEIDLVAIFKGFVPAAIMAAGLQDGVNPCAFTVIVFFISFLALQGYRKRELFFIGISFIFAVFLTYLLLGLGIFNFFYRLKGFLLISRLFNITVGVLSILFGIFAVYDYIKFKKTGSTEELILQLPKAIKLRIQKVVGFFYRKGPGRGGHRPAGLIKLIASAFITGFLVSILEAVCTGQVYLPTISFILKSTELKLQALGYLLLYNIMFVIPLLAIFFLALFGTTSAQFSAFLKKNLGLIKIFMAVLFFSLGIFLIWGI